LRLNCPFCGDRGIEEFSYAGDAGAVRPAPDAEMSAWVDYVYVRDNPAGIHGELWYHAAACRQVLCVQRDTRTHAILSTRCA
jgi:sarcosine oxidase subunit delta